MPITAKSLPECESARSNGLSPFVFSNWRNMLSGFLKMSRGPMNPRIERIIERTATSVEIAADAPFESLSCLPARIARHGM